MIDWYPPQTTATDGLGSDPTQIETDRRAERFIAAVARRNPDIAEHARRSAVVAVAIAKELGWSSEERLLLHQATLLHDVGMLHIPEGIRRKRGVLTADEYASVMEHAAIGAAMVEDVLSEEQIGWIRLHHERPDGRGYLRRTGSDGVPQAARIMAVADAWVAMTVGRPYRSAFAGDRAIAECMRHAGEQFSPECVEALAAVWRRSADFDTADSAELEPGLSPPVQLSA